QRPYRMDPMDSRYNKPPGEPRPPTQPDLHGTLDLSSEHTATAFTTRQAMEAMERLQEGPFAITCSFHHPHAPILPTEPYASMYPAEEMEAPASIGDPMDNSPYIKANGRLNHPEYADTGKIKYMISNYYGLVREIDDWVGTLLGKLDELGLAENTLVIFMSDHGEMLGSHGMREKNIFYEESLRVPLMIRFPGRIAAGVEVDEPVSLLDIYATILDYLGVEAGPCDGKTLRRFIEPHERAKEPFACAEWHWRKDTEPNVMIRTNRWKLFIPNTPTSRVLDAMYNLNNDPHEVNNLLGRNPDAPRYARQAEHLKDLMLSWLEDVNYPYIDGVRGRALGKVIE
ncbi:MAG: sulfatase-like hydrolase/transferase, partial [Candidatus Latescibacteria bacterium]|nr:sulfatase-like hydrolase/transferase [Candidatus Latescibacterota bacterium]